MSWGARLNYKDAQFTVENESGLEVDEHDEQYHVALDAVEAIVSSGALGDGGFTVTLSGHGNPNHEKVSGWSNDFVQITVVQA